MSDLVREIERRSGRAWPARHVVDVGGWEVRFAGGYTGRANSVNPFGPASGSVASNIRRCEDLFRGRELRPVFRITPALDPRDLDSVLEARGYVRRSDTLVMTREGEMEAGTDAGLDLPSTLSEEWLRLCSKWTGIPPEREELHRALLEGIEPERVFAVLRDGEEPVACGLAVREPPWVGLFDLATAPECRHRGFGTRLVHGLLRWGADGAAGRAYLQVVADNGAAVRLYRALGFRDAYPYWYRVSTEDSPHRLPKAPDWPRRVPIDGTAVRSVR